MLSKVIWRLGHLVLIAGILVPGVSYAACTMPNNLTNGQVTDATKVMGNFSAMSICLDNNGSVNSGAAGQVGVYDTSGNDISGKSLSDIIDGSISSTQGTILYRGSSGWQALPPGTTNYVLSTNGAGADPSWIPQGGGSGGGGKFQAFPGGATNYSVGAAASADAITVTNTIAVSDLAALFSPVTGGTYKMGLAGWDPATRKITSTPVYTGSETVATGGTGTAVNFTFTTPVALTAGKYVVMLIRTDGTPTTSMGLIYGGSGSTFWAPRLTINGSSAVFRLASQSPTTSDVWTSEGGGIWTFALMYSF